ncbi:hypothetical protein VB712_19090 [Spirulina sp. CCNP1310]|uniref:AAA family ATPase n=1 Tax=Spirulina sp. CCNP1310 TaxID=3110249 RepID=UPI002B21BB1B|nr:hypothetical protein [Spirulina sp. CCNP1310]MEA5421335.1 hypothetical protein [Spirulina sp. CCNP1310]
MSDEKLIIHNFAGIKSLEIDVKKINIFIGPQASGKSVIAKLLFYCKQFIREIINQGINLKNKRDLDRELKNKFETYFPRDSWGNHDFSIKYIIGDESIEISKSNKEKSRTEKIKIKYSDFYLKHLTKVRKIATQFPELTYSQSVVSQFRVMHDIRQRFLNDVIDQLGSVPSFWQLFIPAGRSFFATLRNSIFGFLSENNNIDPFLIEFGGYYEQLKKSHPTMRTIDIKELSKKIILS